MTDSSVTASEGRTAVPRPARRAFEEILDRLEQAIASGELGPGDKLPPERELAHRFGVSRPSVREALRVLEALGLVTVRRGADHGVTLREEPGNALAHLFRFHLALRHTSVESLVAFRIAVESWAAGDLAAAPDPVVIEELERHLAAMQVPAVGQVGFHAHDAAFHLALVRGGGNELATAVLEASRDTIQRTMLQAIVDVEDWPATHERLVTEHRAILDAVRRGDPGAASLLVAGHIRRFYDERLR